PYLPGLPARLAGCRRRMCCAPWGFQTRWLAAPFVSVPVGILRRTKFKPTPNIGKIPIAGLQNPV
ncbi:MAG: hypothetical protein ACK5XN_05840, partial [Bacteroidota bacterium]